MATGSAFDSLNQTQTPKAKAMRAKNSPLTNAVNRHTLTPVSPKRRVSFFLDEHLADGLKALKARDGIPEAEAIRRAIGEYLEQRGAAGSKSERTRAATRKRS
jgi:hypothetical protein